jgi:hypothetical protein
LREIEPSKGGRPKETPDGGDPSLDESESPPHTRTKAATEAGPSERQRKTALRVANIPRQEFEEAVEAEEAPDITHLAQRGTVHGRRLRRMTEPGGGAP